MNAPANTCRCIFYLNCLHHFESKNYKVSLISILNIDYVSRLSMDSPIQSIAAGLVCREVKARIKTFTCCNRDGGRPTDGGLQEQPLNHPSVLDWRQSCIERQGKRCHKTSGR